MTCSTRSKRCGGDKPHGSCATPSETRGAAMPKAVVEDELAPRCADEGLLRAKVNVGHHGPHHPLATLPSTVPADDAPPAALDEQMALLALDLSRHSNQHLSEEQHRLGGLSLGLRNHHRAPHRVAPRGQSSTPLAISLWRKGKKRE